MWRFNPVPLMARVVLTGWLSLAFASPASAGRGGFGIEVFGGAPINLSTPLEISQVGEENLEFTARYDSKPLEVSYYYAVRFGYWRSGRGWALDLLHHKLYLSNPPQEVQSFSISHGYNILTVQRIWTISGTLVAVGGGGVVTHPESTIRDQTFSGQGDFGQGGYYLSGPALSLGVGRRWEVWNGLHLSVEGRGTLSRVSVPVAKGDASLTHVAIHALVGLGGRF